MHKSNGLKRGIKGPRKKLINRIKQKNISFKSKNDTKSIPIMQKKKNIQWNRKWSIQQGWKFEFKYGNRIL